MGEPTDPYATNQPTNQFGTPVAPTNQFGTPVAPTNQFGTPVAPVAGYPPAGQPASPYGSPGFGTYPAPARRMSTGAKVAIALAASVGGLVVIGILAAIAIPVFLSQQAKSEAAHISVSLPAQVGPYVRVSGTVQDELAQQAQAVPTDWGTPVSAVYGTGSTPKVIVLAGAHPITAAGQRDFLAGAARSAATAGFTLVATDPGPLGGRMTCGTDASAIETACVFVDAGAYGRIEVVGTGAAALDLVRQVRAAVETRH